MALEVFSRSGVSPPTLLTEVTFTSPLIAAGLVTHNRFKKTVQSEANDGFDRRLGRATGVCM